MDLWIAGIGLAVGLMVGMTGVGGASLLTPILILFGINPSIAVGTDLFYNSITKLFGIVQHWRQKSIDWAMVRLLAYGSVPGAVIAIGALRLFESAYHNQETIIKHALGIVLILVAVATVLRQIFHKQLDNTRFQQLPLSRKRGMTVAIGFVLGFVVGLTSIGSGSLFAVAMMFLYRMTAAKVVGTDIAHAFFLVTAAGLLHAGLGNVDYGLALNLLVGSIPGVLLGSTLSLKVPARPLRTLTAALIFVSGLKLI